MLCHLSSAKVNFCINYQTSSSLLDHFTRANYQSSAIFDVMNDGINEEWELPMLSKLAEESSSFDVEYLAVSCLLFYFPTLKSTDS